MESSRVKEKHHRRMQNIKNRMRGEDTTGNISDTVVNIIST